MDIEYKLEKVSWTIIILIYLQRVGRPTFRLDKSSLLSLLKKIKQKQSKLTEFKICHVLGRLSKNHNKVISNIKHVK